jgi:hypothetical protein
MKFIVGLVEEKDKFQIALSSGQSVATPLSTNMLLQAVCQDEEDDTLKPVDDLDEDLVLKYCHNLLVIDAQRGVWVPSHLSVIEYFENHLWSQKQASCLVSKVCLLLLNNTTHYDRLYEQQHNSMQNDSLDDYGFHEFNLYARHHWMIHVRTCEENNKDRLSVLLERFLGSLTDSSPAYQSWHRRVKEDDYVRSSSSFFED